MDLDRFDQVSDAHQFDGVFNLRDLGGLAGFEERTVRPGRLYRADGLFRLAGADLDRFAALGIRDVIDLRRPDELAVDGRVAELPDLAYHNFCLQQAAWTSATVSAEEMAGYLAERYGEIADEALDTGAMGTVLRFLADEPGPTVFHCAAGKDRTGVVAALTLALLGVPDATIAADYAATEASEQRYLAWRAIHQPHLPPYVSAGIYAPAGAITGFLAGLRFRYGSVVDYADRAGLDSAGRAALRARLLTET